MRGRSAISGNTSRGLIVLLCIFLVLIVAIVLFSGRLVPSCSRRNAWAARAVWSSRAIGA